MRDARNRAPKVPHADRPVRGVLTLRLRRIGGLLAVLALFLAMAVGIRLRDRLLAALFP